MNPVNQRHIPIPQLREIFNTRLINEYIPEFGPLDIAFNTPAVNFKLLHHLLIGRYSKVTMHHQETPIPLIGLDIETDHTTGQPKLLGFSYADGFYYSDDNPTLQSFYGVIKGIIDNSPGTQIVTWGTLDINCIIRLFDPTEAERVRVSKGISGKFVNGMWKVSPPILRRLGDKSFCVDHYITGRSLRLGIFDGSRYRTVWIYNLSQFYETRIADTAKALQLEWQDFERDTHLIDWRRFESDSDYRNECLESNHQDARIVRQMAMHLQNVFHTVFDAYPALLVSAGSLADAAVSKILSPEDYAANSWQYLKYSTFGSDDPVVTQAESLLSEAYSAGYVDQFAIGYFPEAFTADISSAYPHKIRQLPDLRYCKLHAGTGDPLPHIKALEDAGNKIFTAVIRGKVTIPENLLYHPITVRTPQKQNIRPLGTFEAAYFIEEKVFCQDYGATFRNETYVIFALSEYKEAPIAQVSNMLAKLRDEYRAKMYDDATSDMERILFDAMQYRVKVIDNSMYGKTVATTEIMEDDPESGQPVFLGYKAGDRFNLLYGGWITATTRVQLAHACMAIDSAGGNPIMAMTDSVYWQGKLSDLPDDMIAYDVKTAGMFEPPHAIHDFYVVKTGQYEYRVEDVWEHKMRGLNLPFEDRSSNSSFYRSLIQNYVSDKPEYMHPEDIEIPVNTRKLVSIGSPRLENLGLVADGQALLRPFVLSNKQSERFIHNWNKTLNGSIRLKPPVAMSDETPYQALSDLYENGAEYLTRHERKRLFYLTIAKHTGLTIANRFGGRMPLEKRRLTEISWAELELWSGVRKEWCRL